MNIICDQERMPGERLLSKMEEGAVFCVESEGIPSDRVEVSLTFVSPEEIQELNSIYRGVDKVTDVLSFPQYEDLNQLPAEGEIPLGDVVICTQQALLQADEFGHSNERELVYLFVHSICHLLGYDHMEEADKQEMRAKEEAVMSKISLER
ncbi:rRNA maturation RNase YbeY [Anaerovorax odorimutans]|uniref:Endoribonuclease YbeY n=1 Tax=Anaerovorax odorimutans TaxID=109327 RepID=A0ABT1RMB7_9FIRM|nr:rRNA maturation RNase YbeY [Anaerovorax odorimutans]MCQ4636315.1 rRNA maturation RNase YbeY [Anaerovorax odorimutans]